jgi:hypothetical protein
MIKCFGAAIAIWTTVTTTAIALNFRWNAGGDFSKKLQSGMCRGTLYEAGESGERGR